MSAHPLLGDHPLSDFPSILQKTDERPSRINQPFRFLDLRPELRLMVYENIDFTTTRHVISPSHLDENANIVVVHKTLPVSILATCTLVKAEAQSVLEHKLDRLRDAERYHMIIDAREYRRNVVWISRVIIDLALLVSEGRRQREIDGRAAGDSTAEKRCMDWDPDFTSFFNICVAMSLNQWPQRFTFALRLPSDMAHNDREGIMNDVNFWCGDRLAYLVSGSSPAEVRFCDVKELIEQGREDEAILEKDSSKKHFRFLDLPAELRCMVYENIDFGTTSHVLDRVESLIDARIWPAPPPSVVHDSTLQLIRPHVPLDILATCKIVRKEALPIFQRRFQDYKRHPLRYTVDFSAAWALLQPLSQLGKCIGLPPWLATSHSHPKVGQFKALCSSFLTGTKETPTGMSPILITILHKADTIYGREVFLTLMWLGSLKDYITVSLEIVYETTSPHFKFKFADRLFDGSNYEPFLREELPSLVAGDGNRPNNKRGVFIRPLGKDTFAEHLKSLEKY